MIFSYAFYLRIATIVPLLIGIFLVYFLSSFFVGFVQEIIKRKITAKSILFGVITIILCCDWYFYLGSQFISSGVYLMFEQESDAVEIVGVIDEIYSMNDLEFPRLKSNYDKGTENGVCFVIDGVRCKAIRCGDFKVGDQVKVRYLPQSTFVLSIQSVQSETQ